MATLVDVSGSSSSSSRVPKPPLNISSTVQAGAAAGLGDKSCSALTRYLRGTVRGSLCVSGVHTPSKDDEDPRASELFGSSFGHFVIRVQDKKLWTNIAMT